jgi:hypothetical protein
MPEGMHGCTGCRKIHPLDWFYCDTHVSCALRRALTDQERADWAKKKLEKKTSRRRNKEKDADN